jgi:hypothetical protein
MSAAALLSSARDLTLPTTRRALPDSELVLFSGRRAQNKLMQQLAAVVRDYFASPVNTISSA